MWIPQAVPQRETSATFKSQLNPLSWRINPLSNPGQGFLLRGKGILCLCAEKHFGLVSFSCPASRWYRGYTLDIGGID